jgi:hypothetical protein
MSSSEDVKQSGEETMSFLFNNTNSNEVQWCFSQVKGALDDDVTEGRFLLLLLLFIIVCFYKKRYKAPPY